jgi:hypothetical protein
MFNEVVTFRRKGTRNSKGYSLPKLFAIWPQSSDSAALTWLRGAAPTGLSTGIVDHREAYLFHPCRWLLRSETVNNLSS